MKFWDIEKIEDGHGTIGLNLIDHDRNRVLSISVSENNKIRFLEECDAYFDVEMDKNSAIEALYEAIDWVKQQEI